MADDALRLFDSTLRDGADALDFSPAPELRSAIAHALVGAGIDAIELATSDAEDVDGVCALAGELGDVETCVIGPATSDAVAKALVLLAGSRRPRIHLYADAAPPGALAPVLEAVFAARVNVDQVEVSPLRAFELEPETLLDIVVAASDSGATTVNLSDTRGTASPDGVRTLFERVAERLAGSCATSFHGHDRSGRAVANALAACAGGARQIHVCVGGVGPNGGNTSLEAFVEALDTSSLGLHTRVDRAALAGLTALVERSVA
jgi:2-isopropylmalate synthase